MSLIILVMLSDVNLKYLYLYERHRGWDREVGIRRIFWRLALCVSIIPLFFRRRSDVVKF